MTIQDISCVAKNLDAPVRPNIAGTFPTTPQSINAADWHQYARELIEAAYLAAFVFAVWLAVSGFLARLDHADHLTGGAQ
jgi:hypothetical protein